MLCFSMFLLCVCYVFAVFCYELLCFCYVLLRCSMFLLCLLCSPESFGSPGRFESSGRLGENNFHVFSSRSEQEVLSYDIAKHYKNCKNCNANVFSFRSELEVPSYDQRSTDDWTNKHASIETRCWKWRFWCRQHQKHRKYVLDRGWDNFGRHGGKFGGVLGRSREGYGGRKLQILNP